MQDYDKVGRLTMDKWTQAMLRVVRRWSVSMAWYKTT